MEKKKIISLTGYVTRILLMAFIGVFILLAAALFLFQLMIQSSMIAPANAGETAARGEIERLKQMNKFPDDLQPSYYDFVYFDQKNQVVASSLSGDKLKQEIDKYTPDNDTYSTGAYVQFDDGSRCLLSWKYTAQFTNETLRRILPSAELIFIIGTGLALVLFFLLYTRRVSQKLREKLVLVEAASQQITAQNLEEPITTSAGILEFNETLQSMEDMREALKFSLLQQWETQQQRKQEIAALTHDIKTPLTVVNGNAELLLEDELEQEQRNLVQAIYHSGNKAKQYVGALQQLSNFEVVNEEKEPLSIDHLIHELNESLAPIAQSKGINLDYHSNQDLQQIVGSTYMLTRALISIGENAIRFTHSGTVNIQVTQTKNETHFIFEDHGPGFSKEALQHAKEMFWQQDKSRTPDSNYGIGLAIAEKAAQLHHGRLVLENTDDGGRVVLVVKNSTKTQ
ncbi:sensor histidine kinase [Candidatus Enterococcus ferrettii]|uniref:histidine kinase n=1 Tax=Candidatus Enterococcus ferrettii TaxID=2815324 RepID=A0ABV0ER07_9ENTE|nr:HAMP domain-containing sensor histidine kinase [Enterococcus sp. 665A]MBO1343089.1 HAMP domain-containing histidine kinase [Enterococcus sp. 665A]